MPYELRAKGRAVQTFDTEDEAVTGARELIRAQPDSDPEIWDTTQPASLRRPPRARHGARTSPARSASDAVGKVRQTRARTESTEPDHDAVPVTIRPAGAGWRVTGLILNARVHPIVWPWVAR
jgi:hypothetical protein